MRHDNIIKIRISSDLRKQITAAATDEGDTVSAFMRKAAAARASGHNPETEKQLLSELVAIREALGRLGNNVNQIARHLNSGGSLAPHVPGKMLTALERLHDHVSAALTERRRAL